MLLALFIIFNFISPSILLATEYEDNSMLELKTTYINNKKVIYYDFRENSKKNISKNTPELTLASGTGILVFVSGYLVGKIVDGIFILTTGKTLENHIVDFVKSVYRNNSYSGNSIRVKIGCSYAPGQPCLKNPKPKTRCGYAPGQPCW